MTPQPNYTITAAQAADLLCDGTPLVDAYVNGEITMPTDEKWNEEVVLENCIVENFSCVLTQFNKPVKLINCHFKNCQFTFVYFLSGLAIDNCLFDSDLDFQAGGHNKAGQPVSITNNTFVGFVNFFDCWYKSEVVITNNIFQKGTNLLGQPHNIPVTFDVAPLLKDNIGRLDFNNEG